MKSKIVALISALLLLIMTLCVRYCSPKEAELAGEIILAVLEVMEEYSEEELPDPEIPTAPEQERVEEPKIPVFTGEPFVTINGNMPFFGEADMTTEAYETYSPLDDLGRCGAAMACVGVELMPTGPRGEIGHIKPTGWHSVRYETVEGGSLYNRCHLLGFQLTGENANRENLITGTRFMNVEGMLPFENMVADYVKETGNHVIYRVTPVFQENELVARGVQMEAWSVEDNGEGICFHVYVYNNQPGVIINYAYGTSQLDDSAMQGQQNTYVLNTGSRKFHTEDCPQAATISQNNRQETTTTRDMLVNQGFEPAGCCKP